MASPYEVVFYARTAPPDLHAMKELLQMWSPLAPLFSKCL